MNEAAFLDVSTLGGMFVDVCVQGAFRVFPDLSRPLSQNEGDNTKKFLRFARNAGDMETER